MENERSIEEKANARSVNCFQKFLKIFRRKQVADIKDDDVNTIPAAIRCIHEPIYPDKNKNNFTIKHIIIDCSCVNFIDSQGVNGILQVNI